MREIGGEKLIGNGWKSCEKIEEKLRGNGGRMMGKTGEMGENWGEMGKNMRGKWWGKGMGNWWEMGGSDGK